MKVKLRSTYAGPRGTHPPGAVVDLSDEECQALIDGDYAEAVERAAPVEAATDEPEENATAARPRRRASKTVGE